MGAALLYELLYIRVFGVEEAELSLASEAFRLGGRRYRNSLSMCSDIDGGYEMPETHRYGTARDAQLESDWSVNVYTAKKKKKSTFVPVDYRDDSEVGGATVEDKHRAVTDDAKVSGLVMSSQVVFFFYYIFIFTLICQRMRRR